MSIRINKEKCVACGKCREVCPGNLIKIGVDKKAQIRHPKECWGCTSCVKECSVNAIEFFLGADIGGAGSWMLTKEEGDIRHWIIHKSDGSVKTIQINKKNSNQY
ncbi:MAG: ferredoxin family protein [Hespellia sp.]|nr:ferredoxin family protein [Hespellia sp.]